MKRLGKLFLWVEDGYMLLLMLILLPSVLSVNLLLIDIARISNAQGDLQAIADATALAGARELDRSPNAIVNARAAMAELTNSVSMLSPGGAGQHLWLTYANAPGNAIDATFLDEIPEDDLDPIDAAWLAAHEVDDADATEAIYVYVRVRSRDFRPLFHFIVPEGGGVETGEDQKLSNFTRASDTPVGASAVAKSVSAACNVTPIYICNPFEADPTYPDIQEAFRAGQLHSRLFKLHPPGPDLGSPGNFGFLQVTDPGGSAIRAAFASNVNPTCYDSGRVTTKPGGTDSIRQGLNVRFDVYDGPYTTWRNDGPNTPYRIAPAQNVRKGYRRRTQGNPTDPCNLESSSATEWATDGLMPFPDDANMQPPNQGVAGASFGDGDWPRLLYLTRNYGSDVAQGLLTAMTDVSDFPAVGPSRYEVYLYELANDHPNRPGTRLHQYVNTGTDNHGRESGAALCGPSRTHPITPATDSDRRVIFAAIIDCIAQEDEGGGVNNYAVNSFASIFLTRPMTTSAAGNDGTIDVEIVDITGSGTGGSLVDFVRDEAVLVR